MSWTMAERICSKEAVNSLSAFAYVGVMYV